MSKGNIVKKRRYIVVKNETEVLCELAQQYYFKPLNNIGDTSIKIYKSKRKALATFKRMWGKDEDNKFEAVEIEEVIRVKRDKNGGSSNESD